MKVILAALALVCLTGATLAALHYEWRHAAAWAFGFVLASSWFIAVRTAERVIDEEEL